MTTSDTEPPGGGLGSIVSFAVALLAFIAMVLAAFDAIHDPTVYTGIGLGVVAVIIGVVAINRRPGLPILACLGVAFGAAAVFAGVWPLLNLLIP